MPKPLHTHFFGPADAPHVLALHGLTGHGRRWASIAENRLAGLRVVAPDLLGHGESPWTPPWSLEAHADAVDAVIDAYIDEARRPVVVVAHSYGSAIALTVANRRPELVKALILLDPAQGLDPERARQMAEGAAQHCGYPTADDAAAAKRAEGWSQVPQEILEAEIAEHLVDHGDHVDWRVSLPTAVTAWSEMARPAQLPPPGVPTHVVVADRVDPPFVTPGFLAAVADQRPGDVVVHHVDTEHMVPFLAPDLVAGLIRDAV
ncbi:MAG: alpha/beta hydrolase [Gordonia sp. (in: high G+C Gram-positive bacteria)]